MALENLVPGEDAKNRQKIAKTIVVNQIPVQALKTHMAADEFDAEGLPAHLQPYAEDIQALRSHVESILEDFNAGKAQTEAEIFGGKVDRAIKDRSFWKNLRRMPAPVS